MDKGIRLALETGIGGGSVSLVAGRSVLDSWKGDRETPKADFLLEGIEQTLKRNGLERSSIREVVCSTGPGSQTGLKIGFSLAKGICTALGIPLLERDLFECIFENRCKDRDAGCIIVLPGGRKDFLWRYFDRTGKCLGSGKIGASDNAIGIIPETEMDRIEVFAPLEYLGEVEFSDAFGREGKEGFTELGGALSDYIGLC